MGAEAWLELSWSELGLSPTLAAWLVLAALPLVLAACTAFTKIAIVLAAVRQGLSADRLLPVSSMLALGVALTAVVMAPVASACAEALAALLDASAAGEGVALGQWLGTLEPLRGFMATHTDPAELERLATASERGVDDPLILVPAFLVSELGAGLQLAVLVLLPFVVIDLIVAEVQALLGLQQTPSVTFALPAKVLVFLAADGWQLVVVGLVEGYQ